MNFPILGLLAGPLCGQKSLSLQGMWDSGLSELRMPGGPGFPLT